MAERLLPVRPWQPWGKLHVIAALLGATRTPAAAAGVLGYYRRRRGPRAFRGGDRGELRLALRGLSSPLHVSPGSGGLATYYEIVSRRIYAPFPDFVPRPGQTVVDVGANIGVFSLWAASRMRGAGRLLAVEPHPAAFAMLARNLAGVTGEVRLVPAACAEKPGSLILHVTPGKLSVSSMQERAGATQTVTVPADTLDDMAAELDRVDLLKVDVEGAELPVLRGADGVLGRTERLALETTTWLLPELLPLLTGHGLEVVSLRTGMWGLPWAVIACLARG